MKYFSEKKIRALLRVAPKEVRRAWHELSIAWPPEHPLSPEDLRGGRGPVIVQLVGCRCGESVEQKWCEVIERILEEFNGELPRYHHDIVVALRKSTNFAARECAQSHACHHTSRGFTCYCDEHKH